MRSVGGSCVRQVRGGCGGDYRRELLTEVTVTSTPLGMPVRIIVIASTAVGRPTPRGWHHFLTGTLDCKKQES